MYRKEVKGGYGKLHNKTFHNSLNTYC